MSFQPVSVRASAVLALCALSACSGGAGDPEAKSGLKTPDTGNGGNSGGTGGSGVVPVFSDQLVPGGAFQRVSVRALHATLDQLFPELAATRPSYPPDAFARFDTERSLDTGLAFVETTAVVMGDLVKQARLNPQVWSRIRTCAPESDTAACLGELYDAWAPRLLRRPGSPEERAELVALAGKDLGSTDDVLAMAFEALLRNPEFTHRVELGEGDTAQRILAAHETLNRMAFLLWGEAPDDTLRNASPPNLSDAATRVEYAKKMLEDPRARRQIVDYHAQWIGYATMPRAGLGQDMWNETAALINRVVFEGAPYEQLFLSEESYLTPALAEHYGLPPIAAPGWTSTAGSGRLGLFGQGAFLQAYSNVADTSPVKRGKNVLSRFLCVDIELPPNVDVDLDVQPEPGQCRVEFFRETHAAGPCAGCHSVLDGVGFALETFDKTGKARTHETGSPDCPLDGVGSLAGVEFQGPAGLARTVATHDGVDECVVQNLAHFVLGVSPSQSPEGEKWVSSLKDKYLASGARFDSLLLDIVQRPEFALVAPR